ncbi:cyclohexanone monooxygenase [Erythrobacter sp. SG61-1L]|uniref:flavin-containing monooxygenase n=1 Tax=Erythrobacter sp. SG61-1L TaxID=1603897 RepID=UPI0006C901E0|nr:NAD(P)/FAD-dependent oxidoreductase [Erythrobacter sp. SG61-1L]KPL68656.1 cyclohexanone monooxygenase [Erythrobacter sp. SG61-1L]
MEGRNPVPSTLDVLVVGAGFTGLYMQLKLRQAGFSSHVVEAGSGVGGTWYWNRYPGARCDIPSIEYSYSFSPELEKEWRWTERYAAQPEILAYLDHVADRFDLKRDITFDTRVTSARWNEAEANWTVETDMGDIVTARFVVLGTGALSAPKTPDLPGIENFAGPILHTATWDDKIDLADKRIAIFGTGSSGIQAIPQLAKAASRLTVFQRTPNFAVPANNRDLSDEEFTAAQATLQQDRESARNSPLGFFGAPHPGAAKAQSEDARSARFEQQWGAGTTGMLMAYEDLLFDEESNSYAARFINDKIAGIVKDPAKVRKMSPQYPLGSRRMCSEIGFYETMAQDNVTLVDVREDPVAEITADAVVTESGAHYPADVIVFATGFDACVGAIKAIDIHGRGGVALREEWELGPRCYLGLAVAGFPNLFTVTGPGSPSVLSNVVVSIEQHVEWIARCLEDLREQGAASIEAEADAEQAWMTHADEVANMTLFPRADSWYKGRTRDGREVFMPYVGGVGAYREKCEQVAASGYEGFAIRQAPPG